MAVRPAQPFPDEPVQEIYLPKAPLVAVVAQVRFPAIVSIAREDFIGPFQEQVRSDYPVLHQIKEIGFVVGPQGMNAAADGGPIWRFRDAADTWGVSLAPTFLALETKSYLDRDDFIRRFHAVLTALSSTIRPATIERFGLRYADRIALESEDTDTEVDLLVRPELAGVATVAPGSRSRLVHTFTDTLYELEGASLHARWGFIPPNAQLDPFHGDAIPKPSWLLDLDMYTDDATEFDVEMLVRSAAEFADRIYAFFRWAVEDELLRRSGAAL